MIGYGAICSKCGARHGKPVPGGWIEIARCKACPEITSRDLISNTERYRYQPVAVDRRMGRKDRRRIHGRYSKYQENPK